MATMAQICEFFNSGRIALVGVSRNAKDFTRVLFREFLARGYDAVPVHPGVGDIEGHPCFARIQEITPPVEAALLLTAPQVTIEVVRDCAAAGVTRIWMYRGTGAGAVSREALAYCQANGIQVVAGECPMMFFPDAGFPHRFHGFLRRITGRYPQ